MHKEYIARLDKVTKFIADCYLVELTQEMLSIFGFKVEAIALVNNRATALDALVLLIQVASGNPLLDLVAEFGELPAEITLMIPTAQKEAIE